MKGNLSLAGGNGNDNVYYIRNDTVNTELIGISSSEFINKVKNNEPCTVYGIYDDYFTVNTFLFIDKICLTYGVELHGIFRSFEGDAYFVEAYVGKDLVEFNILGTMWDYPCLIEGTPINMADGSVKAIEDVKSGDIVQSYNPVTKELAPAVVVKSYITGYSRDFTVYNFSNGSHLTIYGLHGFYNSKSGAPKDIQKITRDDRLITLNGDEIQWAGSREMRYSGEKKRRYNIVTSNNLYFANGILLGSRAPTKLQFAIDRHMSLPEDIRAVWQKDCDDYNAYESFIDTPEFYREVAEDYQELAKANNIIKVNKKRLADSDYKVQKYTEGLIDDAEWKESKDKRALWRKQINDNEEAVKVHKERVDAAIKKRRGTLTPRSLFEACCERDNALFEVCKEHFAKGRGE